MASSVSMLEHICHICHKSLLQFWHVVQNCSTENVCAVCEKYDVYAENDFLGIFPCRHCPHGKIPKNAHWATPPPPFWEFHIGKNSPFFPFLSIFLAPPKTLVYESYVYRIVRSRKRAGEVCGLPTFYYWVS